jgi:hypothetical protein
MSMLVYIVVASAVNNFTLFGMFISFNTCSPSYKKELDGDSSHLLKKEGKLLIQLLTGHSLRGKLYTLGLP